MPEDSQKRIVFAPQPALVSSAQLPVNRVISVELGDDEDVEWLWVLSPDGTQYVSGYNIVPQIT